MQLDAGETGSSAAYGGEKSKKAAFGDLGSFSPPEVEFNLAEFSTSGV